MKKLLSIILFALLCCYAMAYDFSAVCSTGQTLYYNITSNVEPYMVEVTSENADDPYYTTYPTGNLEIPETVEYNSITYSVTGIGESALSGCEGLTSVTIPNSVTSIGNSAFFNCSELVEITIPNLVTNIESHAFQDCRELVIVIIGNSVTNIGEEAFRNCENLTSISIPSTVTSIGQYAFQDTGWYNNQADGILYLDNWCIGYKGERPIGNLALNEETKGIAGGAFSGCSEITDELTIPNSVTSIGYYAFDGCRGLTSVTIPNSVTSIGGRAFFGCSGLTEPVYNASIFAYFSNGYATEYTIPEGIQQIAGGAFSGCNELTSITIPNSVTSIGNDAFSDCSELTTVTISDSVTSIGYAAFLNCYRLTSVIIPNLVTNIGFNTFQNCYALWEVTIGNSVNSIGEGAFYGCSLLRSVIIGNSVAEIESMAFYNCNNIREINISTVTPPALGEDVFSETTYTSATLWTPCTLDETYRYNSQWSQFTNIQNDTTALVLTVQTADIDMGSVTGSGYYSCEAEATLTATPATGYRFLSWNDGNTDNPRTITVTSDSTFVANFRSAETIFWSCDFEGDEIWTFGNDQPDGNVQWQITTPETYPSTLISGDNAYLTPFVFNGDTLNITPEHWALADLMSQSTDLGGPGQVAESSWIQFNNIDLSEAEHPQITFRQIFRQLNGVETSIKVSTDGGQTWADHIVNEEVEDNTYGEYEIRTGIFEAARTDNITIRFLFNSDAHTTQMGYGWEIDDIKIKEAPDTIIATAGEGGTISPSGEVLVDDGDDASFTITPNTGYRIASVMVDGTENATDQLVDGVYTFENVTASHSIEATFEAIPSFTITVSVNNDAYGSVSGGGTYEEGSEVVITATPNQGYRFVQWDDGNMDNPRTIIVTSDSTFVANFIQIDIDGGIERRNVLVELFAYKNCGYSPYAAAALDNMEAADSLNIIVINHHVSDTYGYTESMNRFYYWAEKDDILGQSYGFDGTPSVVFDGYLGMSGTNTNVDEMQETYIGYYNNVKTINSLYSLNAEFEQTELESRTFVLNVTAEKHSEYFGDDQIVVMAALAEDIDYDWGVAGKINNLVRVLYPDANGTEATFDGNNRFSTSFSITISEEYDISKCKVVVWVENHTQGRVMQSKRFNVMDFYNLQAQQYTITVLSNNDAYGTVSGGGTYDEGSEITLSAMPNQGYVFDSWEDGNYDNPRSVTVTSDSTFIADFVKCEITQTIDTVVPNFVTVGDHTFYSTGNYSFSVLSENDCDTIFDIRLRVLAEPVYDIGPNPTKSLLNINSDGFISAVEFYSVTGQLVMRKEVNGYEAEFDMEGLVDGVYILRIYGEESSLPAVSKVVKE